MRMLNSLLLIPHLIHPLSDGIVFPAIAGAGSLENPAGLGWPDALVLWPAAMYAFYTGSFCFCWFLFFIIMFIGVANICDW